MQEWRPTTFTRILIPLDGSPLAEIALKPAINIAQTHQAELLLLRVTYLKELLINEGGIYGYYWWEEAVEHDRQEASDYLAHIKETAIPPTVSVRTLVIEGDEPGSIVDTAKKEQVDLIVMSTHGRSGISHWMLGSITEKVLRAATCPVLVTRSPKPVEPLPGRVPAPPPADNTITKILITLDGSPLAEQALSPALGIAQAFQAEVILLRVCKHMPDVDQDFIQKLEKVEQGLGEKVRRDHIEAATSYLEKVAREVHHLDIPVQKMVTEGPVAKSILHFAQVEPVDLIVMTTHGWTGLRRWAYGRVTEKVLRGANSAVMIVRPPADHRTSVAN